MPTLIPWAIAAIGAEIGSAVLIIYAAEIAAAVVLIGTLALSSAAAQRAKRSAKDAYNASQVDRLVNSKLTAPPRELVLGRVRKGGSIFFEGTTGENKTVFVRCIALAGHEIQDIEQIYFDDVPVTLDGQGIVMTEPYTLGVTGSATATADASGVAVLPFVPVAGSVTAVVSSGTYGADTSNFEQHTVSASVSGSTVSTVPFATINYQHLNASGSAVVRWHLGNAGQAADAELIALFPGVWTAAHRLDNVAYLVCKFIYNETAFPSGLPTITARLRGASTVYDSRDGGTRWTDNPALLMRHVYTHPQFGQAICTATENARFSAAANACDILHTYTVASVGSTRQMFRAGLVAQEGAPANATMDDLAQAMGGMWAYAGGEIYVKPGVYSAPVMALADADLAVVQRDASGSTSQQPITISTHRERASKFNSVNITIWDDAQDYKSVSLTPLTGAALLARDGALLTQAVTFSAIGYAPQAQHVGGIMMRDARDPVTVALPFKLSAYPLELFDTVSLTLTRYGWSAKTFIVMAREYHAQGFIGLTLKETGAAIYQPDAAFLPQGYEANSTLPNAWDVPLVGPLTVTSGDVDLIIQADGTVVNRMRVSWPTLTDAAVLTAGEIEVQFRRVGDTGAWTSVRVPGNEVAVYLENVHDTIYYIVRARARTTVAVGNWCAQVLHQVMSKASGPANYDTFDMTFGVDGTRIVTFGYTTTPRPLDLFGARIKFVSGFVSNPPWSSMALLHPDLFLSGFETLGGTPGSYTFAIKAVDTSDNESGGTRYIQRTLPPIVPKIFDTAGNVTFATTRLMSAPTFTFDTSALGNPVGTVQIFQSGFGVALNVGHTGSGQGVYVRTASGIGVDAGSVSGKSGQFFNNTSNYGVVLGSPTFALTTSGPVKFGGTVFSDFPGDVQKSLRGDGTWKGARSYIHIDDFGAVGDGSTNDTTALQSFFASAIANPGVQHVLGPKIYACSGLMPTISVNGVWITGDGCEIHDVGVLMTGSVIKWIGASSVGPLIKCTAIAGGSNQHIGDITLSGFGIDQNYGALGYAIQLLSVVDSVVNVDYCNPGTVGLDIGVVASLGEYADSQRNKIRMTTRHIESPISFAVICGGSTLANTSFNEFHIISVVKDRQAVYLVNSDNNDWWVRVNMVGGGTATECVSCLGGASFATKVRAERFHHLSSNLPLHAYGTPAYAYPATSIRILIDVENGTPAPVIDPGAGVYWTKDTTEMADNQWLQWIPTVSSSGGTVGANTSIGKYCKRGNFIIARVQIIFSTNGTGTGSVGFTFPVASLGDFGAAIYGKERAVSGKGLAGYLDGGGAALGYYQFSDLTYPGIAGSVHNLTCVYEC